jgi:hypothetical protein
MKILQNRNNILAFRQSDSEYVATAWERLNVMLTDGVVLATQLGTPRGRYDKHSSKFLSV